MTPKRKTITILESLAKMQRLEPSLPSIQPTKLQECEPPLPQLDCRHQQPILPEDLPEPSLPHQVVLPGQVVKIAPHHLTLIGGCAV